MSGEFNASLNILKKGLQLLELELEVPMGPWGIYVCGDPDGVKEAGSPCLEAWVVHGWLLEVLIY